MRSGCEVRCQPVHHHGHGGAGIRIINLLDPRLAVNAKPEFRLAMGNPVFLGRTRHSAGVQRHADRDRTADGFLRCLGNRLQIRALIGERSGDLVHEQRTGDTARLRQVRQGNVVIDNHHVDLQSEGAGPLGRKTKVQPVAGVVLDDQQAAGLAGDGQNARQHGIHGGRCKHLAADGRREHALADETCMAWLMTRAAAGDKRHLGFVPVGAHHHLDMRIAVETGEPSAGRAQHAVNRFGDERFLGIDELLHVPSPQEMRAPLASKKSGFLG